MLSKRIPPIFFEYPRESRKSLRTGKLLFTIIIIILIAAIFINNKQKQNNILYIHILSFKRSGIRTVRTHNHNVNDITVII